MSPKAQNKAIAEACGRRYHRATETEMKSGSYYQYEPDYLKDLNLMHEAEKVLNVVTQGEDYFRHLQKQVTQYRDCICWAVPIVMATASQRAEAFLRTIGKWEE